MFTVLKPFTRYITYLAKGRLDGYLNSVGPEDLPKDLGIKLPTQPMLLLHDLGKSSDMGRIERLFVPGTVLVPFLSFPS